MTAEIEKLPPQPGELSEETKARLLASSLSTVNAHREDCRSEREFPFSLFCIIVAAWAGALIWLLSVTLKWMGL